MQGAKNNWRKILDAFVGVGAVGFVAIQVGEFLGVLDHRGGWLSPALAFVFTICFFIRHYGAESLLDLARSLWLLELFSKTAGRYTTRLGRSLERRHRSRRRSLEADLSNVAAWKYVPRNFRSEPAPKLRHGTEKPFPLLMTAIVGMVAAVFFGVMVQTLLSDWAAPRSIVEPKMREKRAITFEDRYSFGPPIGGDMDPGDPGRSTDPNALAIPDPLIVPAKTRMPRFRAP
jgi:hypothetical protein